MLHRGYTFLCIKSDVEALLACFKKNKTAQVIGLIGLNKYYFNEMIKKLTMIINKQNFFKIFYHNNIGKNTYKNMLLDEKIDKKTS